jgi:hypothetical protein
MRVIFDSSSQLQNPSHLGHRQKVSPISKISSSLQHPDVYNPSSDAACDVLEQTLSVFMAEEYAGKICSEHHAIELFLPTAADECPHTSIVLNDGSP